MSHGRPYPPDEFDVDVVPDGPRGVHRAPRSAWSRWAPFLAVLVVAPVLAFVLVTWLSSWEGAPDVDLPVFGDAPSSSEPATPPSSGAATEEPTGTAEPEQTPTPEPPPEPDLDRDVEVYNATSIAGLAGGAGGELEAAGFTAVTTGNWAGADPAASVVYYPSEEDEGTAQEVAGVLGIETVTLDADRSGGAVAVVLLEDFAG